jgi:hypothetical protein
LSTLNLTPLTSKKQQYKDLYKMMEQFETVFHYYEKTYGQQHETLTKELETYLSQNVMGPALLNLYESSEYKDSEVFLGMVELIIQELSLIYKQSERTLKEVVIAAEKYDTATLKTLLISELRKKQIRTALKTME